MNNCDKPSQPKLVFNGVSMYPRVCTQRALIHAKVGEAPLPNGKRHTTSSVCLIACSNEAIPGSDASDGRQQLLGRCIQRKARGAKTHIKARFTPKA